jgi:hypothetical protein
LVSKDAADDALSSYRNAQMPYLQGVQKKDRQQHIKRLVEEVSRGALSITPVMPKKVKSRLKTRIIQRTTEDDIKSSKKFKGNS